MKTATLPSLRVDPKLRGATESVLEEGETLSGRWRAEFIARGLALPFGTARRRMTEDDYH